MKHKMLFTITALLGMHTHLPASDEIRTDTVKGGAVTGGSVTGGSVTGGNVTGGSVQGGKVTRGQVSAGTVTASAEERKIRVTAAGAVSVNVNGTTAEVRLGSQTLVVEKTKLLLDGNPLGEVPQNTQRVEVQVDDKDVLTVKGDGKELARAKIQPK